VTAVAKPGLDEIALSAPEDGTLCHSLEHTRAGRAAAVVVTFGELGTRYLDELWLDSWGRSYPMCPECWDGTRAVAQGARPALVVTDTR
jgi:hypothetical protein